MTAAAAVPLPAGDCAPCEEALELDRIAVLVIDEAEIAVIACPRHLGRVVLAIELLEEREKYHPTDPPTPEQLDRRVRAMPVFP
jgi:hypothetical protein